jgi:hypothetical protein
MCCIMTSLHETEFSSQNTGMAGATPNIQTQCSSTVLKTPCLLTPDKLLCLSFYLKFNMKALCTNTRHII